MSAAKKRTFHEQGATLTLHDRGTHHELLDAGGRYAHLYRQFIQEAE